MAKLRISRSGFTLIEVLVAATIIAVLVAIGMVSYSSVNKRSRDAKRRGDIEQMRSALELFRSEYGYYPSVGSNAWTNASGLNTGDAATGLVPSFMPSVPSDPKSTQQYSFKATNASSGIYYGYCLSAKLETISSTTSTCTGADVDTVNEHNYGSKNP
ncbi:prepilin-type N-terminal cleavage/methylation domain-containing protein [Candidatus Gottesmanbacteria bacterium]|nr:prepilin-type N-terminal cleavage/methylation domain-containing protein [Candidatus Gottesmanbacteria bacterium]